MSKREIDKLLIADKDALPDVLSQPANERVLAYCRRIIAEAAPAWFNPFILIEFAFRALGKGPKPISKPRLKTGIHFDHFEIGSHQDGSRRIWEYLGPSLPAECRFEIYRRPALVHPRSAVIFALGGGVTYLRLPEELVSKALGAGAKTTSKFTWDDTSRDLGSEWGIIEDSLPEDARWCEAAYRHFGSDRYTRALKSP